MRDISSYTTDMRIHLSDIRVYLPDIRLYMSDIPHAPHKNVKKLSPKSGREFSYTASAEVTLFSVRVTK